jgi:hypothetical protein
MGLHETPDLQKMKHRKLVLHFDVRNTILVADTVTNVNVEQALNSFLTSVTWGQVEDNQWQWCCDEPVLSQPKPGAITYYKYLEQRYVKKPSDRALLRQITGDFTQEEFGARFYPYFKKHLEDIRWTFGPSTKPMTMEGSDGSPYHYIIPAFFKLLYHLTETGRDFCVIIRTYGLDAPNVLKCTAQTLAGEHPMFPSRLDMPFNGEPGRVFRTRGGTVAFENYSQTNQKLERQIFKDEMDIYSMLNQLKGVCAYVDDFVFWQDSDFHHTAGKPLWIDPSDPTVHHIFFDDNIRTSEPDSIVDVRLIEEGKARSLSLEESGIFENSCLVQADLMESTSDVDYFVKKVEICEENYSKIVDV